MTGSSFTPVIHLKQGCPFCFKLRLFLLEANLLDRVDLRETAQATEEHEAARARLAPHFDTVTFPAAEIAPGSFMKETDALIAHFAGQAHLDPAGLATLQAYTSGPMFSLLKLYKENMALKSQAA